MTEPTAIASPLLTEAEAPQYLRVSLSTLRRNRAEKRPPKFLKPPNDRRAKSHRAAGADLMWGCRSQSVRRQERAKLRDEEISKCRYLPLVAIVFLGPLG